MRQFFFWLLFWAAVLYFLLNSYNSELYPIPIWN